MCEKETNGAAADSRPSASAGSITDTDRLVWLRRYLSGKEKRRIGICMSDSGDSDEFRMQIDRQILANARVSGAERPEHGIVGKETV